MPASRPQLFAVLATLLSVSLCPAARAAERITLRNGFQFDCTHREPEGDQVRLYLLPDAAATASQSTDANYIDVPAASVVSVEAIPDPKPIAAAAAKPASQPTSTAAPAKLTPAELRQLLARAGELHDIDADLLAAVVHAESNGNARAVSAAGAQGLMQLMASTASELKVQNAFAPEENIRGGTTYLDQLLTRYHNNLALALAAYNAGPAAVDRYHGIPPFAETRAYVARIIREFNRRKLAARTPATQLAAN